MTDTQETIKAFIERVGLTMTVEPATSNPNSADDQWAKEASHWLCTLSLGAATMRVPFSQGAAHRRWREKGTRTLENCGRIGQVAPFDIRQKHAPVKAYYEKESVALHEYRANCTEPTPPDLESVLNCLAMDAMGYDNARNFDDWASDFGYDPDSRKAERTYRVVSEQAKALRHLVGNQYDSLLACESL